MTHPTSTTLIRTNAGHFTGIGHLVRCLQVAEQLVIRDAKVIFVLDFIEPSILPFLKGFIVEQLYDDVQPGLSANEDSARFINLIKQYQATHIIIDDYRLDEHWEHAVKNHSENQFTLLAIDDVLRKHDCDILVDMKWRGDQTNNAYDQLIPKEAIKLLGPQYVLLNKQYQNNSTKPLFLNNANSELNSLSSQDPASYFTIMFGLGGGGDLTQYQQLIDNVLAASDLLDFKINILLVLGPLSTNIQTFVEQYTDNERVTLLIGKTDLFPYLQQTNLYIGAAGGILYQLFALNIPALTFAIAENQNSDRKHLEQLGHYFHLDNFSAITSGALVNFINSIYKHYARVLHLLENAETKIDAMGALRVAEHLLAVNKSEYNITSTVTKNKLKPKSNTPYNNKPQVIDFPDGYQLRAVNDSDINHYVAARNLPSNCQNMIKAEPIPYLSHYAWWFNAKRDSFLLSKEGQPILYIWHEVKNVDKQNYLIGGWFTCEKEIGFQEALLALNWQLEYCQKAFPNMPWLAVIHRENKFVRLLNKYLGFTDVGTEHAYNSAIRTLFNDADYQNFYYVTHTS